MGNEPSKRSSNKYRSGEGASKSAADENHNNHICGPMDVIWKICAPGGVPTDTTVSQQTDSLADSIDIIDIVSSTSSGKQKTGRSSYHGAPPRPRQTNRPNAAVSDKSDKSIKTSIKNVQKDVSMKNANADQRKKIVPTDDSAHTFAASQSTSHFRKGNDYVMITDALSDVRVK